MDFSVGNQVTLPPSSGKKAKKRVLDSSGIIQHKADLQANCDVCLHALRCLSSLMLHYGPRIRLTDCGIKSERVFRH